MDDALKLPRIKERDIAAIMDPRPLVIVGAWDPTMQRTGFATIIWATPISHDPALVAFALREGSHTMSIVRKTGRFSLSMLPADTESERIVDACGSSSGRTTDKGALVAHTVFQDAPIPEHAFSWEVCEVESITGAGDHLLVVGRVLEAASAAPRDEKGRLAPRTTLLCVQHDDYASLPA